MKKKRIAAILVCAVILLASLLPVYAARVNADGIDINEVVEAIQKDNQERSSGLKAIKNAIHGLKGDLRPYIENVVLTPDNIDTAVELGSKIMIKLYEKILDTLKPEPTEPSQPTEPTEPTQPTEPTDPSQPSNPTEPTEPAPSGTSITIKELANILKKYIFVQVDDPEQAAQLIADDAEIEYQIIEGEGGTYYMRVDIEKYPEIFNYGVFRRVVDDLVEKQNAQYTTDGEGNIDYAMTYEHIAGELAVHAVLYAALHELIEVTGTKNERILSLYESAMKADLNADESRLPWEVFAILGALIYSFVGFNLLKALKLI